MRKLFVPAFVLVLVLASVFVWQANRMREKAQMQLGLDSARVLSQSFATTNQLKVADISGELVARADDPGMIRILSASQTMKAPYTVDYFVDLAHVTGADMRWNAKDNTLLVELPDVIVGKPNIDEGAATVAQTGLYISRAAGLRMQRAASQALAGKASQVAHSPENLERARQSALEAVRKNALAPLVAAGIGNVKVDVRFKFRRNANDDVWDFTTPIDEVAGRVAQFNQQRREEAAGAKRETK